jgi:topoisomerase IA-like protein
MGWGFGNGDVDDEEKAKGNTVASMGTTTGGRSVVKKKPTVRKTTTVKKPVAKKPAAKKTVAKKPAAKKPVE